MEAIMISIGLSVKSEIPKAYTTAALNIETLKTSTFDNFNFNSTASFNGKDLFAGDDGIYEIGGETDNGEKINARIKTDFIDLALNGPSQIY
ncbi:hypothetical protein MCHI_003839 [Candidatus Magnetoovum chiemensis]|nr:hypothetical protein MCHI_003839 [Candidatus Magnetoovum chiemensis]